MYRVKFYSALETLRTQDTLICIQVSGDYRAGVTPLPISNREVKLRIADGTTTVPSARDGRVGRRQIYY